VSDTKLAEAITDIYEQSRRTYGVPRVHAQLAATGYRADANALHG